METEILISQMQGIAQTGLRYGKDPFDRERYEQLNQITMQLMQNLSAESPEKMFQFFSSDVGYATPKVDVRAVVFDEKNEKILMVKEKADDTWSIPGGWADIGYSAKEIAAKEVYEEAGIKVIAKELIAIVDKSKHPYPPAIEYVYKMFILCEPVSGVLATGLETSDVGFKSLAEIKGLKLSVQRNLFEDIERAFAYVNAEQVPATYFD